MYTIYVSKILLFFKFFSYYGIIKKLGFKIKSPSAHFCNIFVLKNIKKSFFSKQKSPSVKCLKGFIDKDLVEASRRLSQLLYK